MGQVNFATQSYTDTSLPVGSERLVNLYAERCPPDAKTQVAVKGSPGVLSFGSAGSGPIRGFDLMGGIVYLVSGTSLYSLSSTGTATFLGSVISGSGPVSMDNNGTQLTIVNGAHGYVYSVAGGFTVINDADFKTAKTVRFIDQRFVFDWAGTNKFTASDTLDGTSYDALAFASAESRPDNVVAVEVHGETLLVFGDKTIEPHQNVGAANFPFERIPGAVIARGLGAVYAITQEDNTVFFLGEDLIFYKMPAGSLTRISTHALEHEWARYAVTSDAVCYSYTFAGHKFIGLTFPTQSRTFQFDIASGLWHERQSWDLNGNPMGLWRFFCVIEAYGKTLVGDAFSGAIGYLSDTTYTELGNTMQGLGVAPSIHGDMKRVFHAKFQLDIEGGVGIASGQGSDPQIMLDWSDDGGHTYTDQQEWTSMGAAGKYNTRLRWTRLGWSYDRRYRITISDPVPRTILAAHADLMMGM